MHNPKTAGTSLGHDLTNHFNLTMCNAPLMRLSHEDFASKYGRLLDRSDPVCDLVAFEGGTFVTQTVQQWGSANGYRVHSLTFLREPITRALSGLEHECRHHIDDATPEDDKTPLGTLKLLNEGRPHSGYDIENYTTHFLADTLNDHGGRAAVLVAKKEMQEMQSVGITENYLASLCLLAFDAGREEVGRGLGCVNLCSADTTMSKYNLARFGRGNSAAPCTPGYALDDIKILSSKLRDDAMLYGLALDRFIADVARVEAATGWNLQCEPSL